MTRNIHDTKFEFSHARNEMAKLLKQVGQTQKVEAPSTFIAGRPKAALLFWFFGDFSCGV